MFILQFAIYHHGQPAPPRYSRLPTLRRPGRSLATGRHKGGQLPFCNVHFAICNSPPRPIGAASLSSPGGAAPAGAKPRHWSAQGRPIALLQCSFCNLQFATTANRRRLAILACQRCAGRGEASPLVGMREANCPFAMFILQFAICHHGQPAPPRYPRLPTLRRPGRSLATGRHKGGQLPFCNVHFAICNLPPRPTGAASLSSPANAAPAGAKPRHWSAQGRPIAILQCSFCNLQFATTANRRRLAILACQRCAGRGEASPLVGMREANCHFAMFILQFAIYHHGQPAPPRYSRLPTLRRPGRSLATGRHKGGQLPFCNVHFAIRNLPPPPISAASLLGIGPLLGSRDR
ncbi:hypothetical protein Enr13x_58240 [Stieleria neptunia]|uniref:Uncharacterized protein n=1 Tax=Stieleria neptunia TaxID=2527979 RepID=A0A518HYJ0_9BACT|nr:hypothetical protein Enr13x_58240 [Stieleria neptunia]